MAINTYASLQTSIAAWAQVNAADLSSVIADIVTLGETRINRELYCKDNESPIQGAIGSNGDLALNPDYRSMKFAYVLSANSSTKLEPRSAEWIYQNYPARVAGGIPKFFARKADRMIFGPYPDSGYAINGVYYKNMPPLSLQVHDAFLNNPDLYLFGCLSKTEILIGRTDKWQMFEAEYKRLINDVNLTAKYSDSSGGTIQMRPG